MQKITRNTFEKGLNTDTDPSKLDPQSYVDAQNVELIADGDFFALKNIKGLTYVSDIISNTGYDNYVLASFSNKYKKGTVENVEGITIFTLFRLSYFYYFRIYAYLEGYGLFLMYQSTEALSYLTADRQIDAKAFAENGIDVLYFTDNFYELRKLRCEIPAAVSAGNTTPVYTTIDISLQRNGANGTITLNSISTGGSLLSGTYQFAYRMLDPSTNVYTKWSTLTNPFHVYNQDPTTGFYTSGYGVFTDRSINLTISPSPNEAQFGYFQLAVIENIYPDGNASALNASLLAIETITPGSTASYTYKSNDKINTIPIEDIVVDYSAIDKAKTLTTSRNRLFIGNIQYKDLSITTPPQVTSGSILKDTTLSTTAISLDTAASTKKGYFRDEVYRFGIVYFDKYGNKSAPYTLDMSAVSGNAISGSTDMKFPKRSSPGYSILDNSDKPQSLGLSLTVQTHPYWAVGFEIVRQKRIKRVLFQSPVIAMMSVKGVGAFENYPSTAVIKTGTTVGTQSYPSAQPQTSDEVLVPKNLYYPELRDISKNTTNSGTSGSSRQLGESYFTRRDNYSTVMLFPQENVYENKDYSFLGCEQLDIVDFVAAKANLVNYDAAITAYGDDADTNIAANFYTIEDSFYYCDSGSAGLHTITENYSIADTLYVDNYSSGDSFGGAKLLSHSDLQTDGISLGYKPNAQRGLICKLSSSIPDECSVQRIFAGGTFRAFPNAGSYIFGSSGAVYINSTGYKNDYIVSQGGFSSTVPVQQFRIANVINPNIGDTRYGDKDSQNEFISTGAKYTFTSGQLTTVAAGSPTPITLSVWGGDCFVTSHVFKVADSAYSVVNETKHTSIGAIAESTLVDRWSSIFRITGNSSGTATLTMPVAVKGAAQYVQMFLESEYNGQAMEQDLLVSASSVSGLNAANRGTAATGTSGSTWSFQPSSNLTTGALAIIAIAYDPGGGAGSDVGITSIYDSHGNPYTLVLSTTSGLGSGAGNGICYRIYRTYQPNGRLLTSSTIYVTFGGTISEKTATITEFYSSGGNYVSIYSPTSSTFGSPGTSPSITSGTILANQAIFGATAAENAITADSDTSLGTWSSAQSATMGNSGSIRLSSQYKIVNTDGTQTYNPTVSPSANYAIGYLYIRETPTASFLLSPPSAANGGSIAVKSCLTYNINKNTIKNNDEKVYFARPDYTNINYKFNSRIHYSDIKIYNSDVQGFDIFRVSNFFDMEESGGPLTKLAVSADNMYGIQERRISYLPASDKLLETADAGVIAVGTSDVLSIARIIDPFRGSQHLRSVIESGDGIFIADVPNKSIYYLRGQQLDIISDKRVATLFRSLFQTVGTSFAERELSGFYDPIKKEYWIVASQPGNSDNFCYVYNVALETWVSKYKFNNSTYYIPLSFAKTKTNIYLISGEKPGIGVNGRVRLYTAYTNSAGWLINVENVAPYVNFYVNPDQSFSKTFDDIMIDSESVLNSLVVDVDHQTYPATCYVLNEPRIEGNYRFKIPRNPDGNGRHRGLRMNVTALWVANNSGTVGNKLAAIFTKYRLSARRPF